MACPFFRPERQMVSTAWAIPPRYPLGDAYLGRCTAPCAPEDLPEDRQASLCNFGYARGRCECFPAEGAPDAVHFSFTGDKLIFIQEIEHAPSSHGVIDPLAENTSVLSAQARAFMASYRRRTEKASAAPSP